jgi:hypothetical protein
MAMSRGGFKMFEKKKFNLINYPFMMVTRSRQYSRERDSRKSCLEEASFNDVEMFETPQVVILQEKKKRIQAWTNYDS